MDGLLGVEDGLGGGAGVLVPTSGLDLVGLLYGRGFAD